MPRTKFISEETVANNTVETEEVKETKEIIKPKKTFDQSEGVKCRSVVQGGLYMEGLKTSMIYSWTDYGDVSEVEYRDLAAAVRSKSKFVYNPWFIIEDEDFLKEFPQIKKFYDESYSIKDLRSILNKPVDEMIAEIEKLPSGAFESMKTIAAKQVSSGNLDSVKKIKALDKLFGTDLNLIGEFTQNE